VSDDANPTIKPVRHETRVAAAIDAPSIVL